MMKIKHLFTRIIKNEKLHFIRAVNVTGDINSFTVRLEGRQQYTKQLIKNFVRSHIERLIRFKQYTALLGSKQNVEYLQPLYTIS